MTCFFLLAAPILFLLNDADRRVAADLNYRHLSFHQDGEMQVTGDCLLCRSSTVYQLRFGQIWSCSSAFRWSPEQSDDGPLDLLVAHKHHDVPGSQAEIRGNESTKRETARRSDVNGRAVLLKAVSGSVPLVEGCGTFFKQHGHGTVQGTAVLARHRVHVARLHHIHRGGHQGGAEAGGEGSSEVAGHVVCREQDTSIRR